MKLVKILLMFILVVALGGFLALGFVNIPIKQQDVVKDIPHDALFND